VGLGPFLEVETRAREQGAHQLPAREWRDFGHCREARYTGTPQNLQQHRFELVILMMRGEKHLAWRERAGQRCVPGIACRSFERSAAGAWDLNFDDFEWDAEL